MSHVPALAATGSAVPVLPSLPASTVRRPPMGQLSIRLRLAFGGVACVQAAGTTAAAVSLEGTPAWLAAGLGGLAVLLTVGLGEWIVRRVVFRILRPATAAVRGLSSGDLRTAVADNGLLHVSPLLYGLREVHERLLNVVREVRTCTVNVAMNTGQVKRDNDALAQRTDVQADSLQETAASMEQLTAAVRQTAATAHEAYALARAATASAEQGGEVMREVVETMDSIRASSRSIHDIIGVIDGIAFQTNILALNAAVEAARAGEQGRGFAVVASEVRVLAQRCAEAAREVKDLIGGSVQKVESGGARVAEAGRAMGDIVASVRQVADLIARVNEASSEQSSGIEAVNEAIARIDGTTQANAGLVKQGRRTVQALHERAAALWKAVDVFDIGEHEHATAEDAMRLVAAGCDYLRRQGLDALIEEVNKLDFGRFIYRDLYLMVLRLDDATFLAHGNNPGRIGTGPQVRDAKGKYFARELARVALQDGSGCVEYAWQHPVDGSVSTKVGYVRREGSVGIYAAIHKG